MASIHLGQSSFSFSDLKICLCVDERRNCTEKAVLVKKISVYLWRYLWARL